MGDELHVIVARSVNVTHKQPPVVPDEQRREMVGALKPVDEAHLGHPEDIFVPIERIEPDIIALATTSTTTMSNSKRRCPPGASTVISAGPARWKPRRLTGSCRQAGSSTGLSTSVADSVP